jgi:hypothetical protein
MKQLFFFAFLAIVLVSCNKYDMPRVPDPPAYGTITFNEVPDNSTTTTVATYDSKKTLYIYSVICAPSPVVCKREFLLGMVTLVQLVEP